MTILRPTAAAARYGLHVNTVRDWCSRGTLPATKTPGGHYRIDTELWDAELKKPQESTQNQMNPTTDW